MTTSPLTNHFSLRDSLAVVLPHLPEQLASAAAIRQLLSLADTLLPIPRALLECHLGNPAHPVDVSQCLFLAERDQFAAFVRERVGWRNIRAFADLWIDPTSPLADGVENVWLEFDTGSSPLPGVFVKLREAEGKQATFDQWSVAEAALNVLLPDNVFQDNLRRCFEASVGIGSVTHIGAMLSRSSDVVRINVAVESAAAALEYLDSTGWPGLLPPFEDVFRQVFDYVENPTLTFDAGAAVTSRIGLECVPGHRFLLGDGWEGFFGFLVERRLCSEEQVTALRSWPGYNDPTNSPNDWPLSLILKTLAQPTASLDVLIRQLNHIKLVFQQDAPTVTAKAYLGYHHENLNPATLATQKNPAKKQGV